MPATTLSPVSRCLFGCAQEQDITPDQWQELGKEDFEDVEGPTLVESTSKILVSPPSTKFFVSFHAPKAAPVGIVVFFFFQCTQYYTSDNIPGDAE